MNPFANFFPYILFILLIACTQPSEQDSEKVLYALDFSKATDIDHFKAETQVSGQEVTVQDGALDIDAIKGATVWFREKLTAPVKIEYTAVVVDKDGPNDRVSDLNCFWMANDPRCPIDIFACADSLRTGKFGDYHTLQTYYVGLGGHDNTKTRFRRYTGDGERPLLPDHDLVQPLIIPNQTLHVVITVAGDSTTYSINGDTLFTYKDDAPYRTGWFAFRTVRNHMRIRDFKVSIP